MAYAYFSILQVPGINTPLNTARWYIHKKSVVWSLSMALQTCSLHILCSQHDENVVGIYIHDTCRCVIKVVGCVLCVINGVWRGNVKCLQLRQQFAWPLTYHV